MATLLLPLLPSSCSSSSSSSSSSSCQILNPTTSSCDRLFSTKIASRRPTTCAAAGGPGRDDGGRQFSFDPAEELAGDLGGRFGFAEGAKQRTWWSDFDDYDDRDDDEDGQSWIFKILKAFGWMLVGISLLLGTGPNTVLMALAVPLAQSALSLVIDKAWDRKGNSSRFKSKARTKKRPFARAATASNVRSRNPKQEEKVSGGDFGSYEAGSRFGGWDDLDRPRGMPNVRSGPSIQNESELPKQPYRRKLSRVGRVREKPLFVRLLIAAFPFLGSWTWLLF